MVNIDINGKATTVTWYEIWEAIMAISSMCVRAQEKGGKATGLGQYFSYPELTGTSA